MSLLDYVERDTMEYKFQDHVMKYGFDWRMVFFQTHFREDQIGRSKEDIRKYVI